MKMNAKQIEEYLKTIQAERMARAEHKIEIEIEMECDYIDAKEVFNKYKPIED